MNPALKVLARARAAGVRVVPDGSGGFKMKAASKPSDAIIEEIRRHKPEIVALLSRAAPYSEAAAELRSRRPEYIEPSRWQQAIRDAEKFLADWGLQAHQLGWTTKELFGLHTPEKPEPSYSRLSRIDETGLIWLLRGRPVVELTPTTQSSK